MTLDVRLSSIVDEASEKLRTSVLDALAGVVVSLPLPVGALRDVARRAYELGYREALAAQGHTAADILGAQARAVAAAPAEATVSADGDADDYDYEDLDWTEETEPDDLAGEVTLAGKDLGGSASTVDWSTIDAPSDVDAAASASELADRVQAPSLRIYPHATIATLRRRIVDVFDLKRFQIDVIVCRKGDRNRRQLKGSVKLSKYLVEE